MDRKDEKVLKKKSWKNGQLDNQFDWNSFRFEYLVHYTNNISIMYRKVSINPIFFGKLWKIFHLGIGFWYHLLLNHCRSLYFGKGIDLFREKNRAPVFYFTNSSCDIWLELPLFGSFIYSTFYIDIVALFER